MSGLISVDAVAASEYKRYRFEGMRPYKKWLKLLSSAGLFFGLLFLGVVALVASLFSQFGMPQLLPWLQGVKGLGIISLSLSSLGFMALGFIYFMPLPVAPLFKAGTPVEVKKLGLKFARTWEKTAPKFFVGIQVPTRKHLVYPGLIRLDYVENQLIVDVKLPMVAVAGGVEEYVRAAAQEMAYRLHIPVKAVSFNHYPYVNSEWHKGISCEDCFTFVLTLSKLVR